ncbi:MAG TPA: arsenate reductase family protein [Ignavibacteriaceae bacterium]|nr:arsenate reductase family protein [Ignavibacteriaceae bacterium]
MNIQIFGTKRCNDTRKAERFFKERNIQFQFRDLSEKGISKGELENILRSVSLEDLIDKNGTQFRKRNLTFMVYDIMFELLSDPLLFKTPVVRNQNIATIGYRPEIWKEWII